MTATTTPRPDPVADRAGDLVADYDRVRTWSDPAARHCELARIGAAAVDLLRQLNASGNGGMGGGRAHGL